MALGKPKPEGVDYRVPESLPILGYGGEAEFERAVEDGERESAETRRINTQIHLTGVVPDGVDIDIHASSHPSFSADAWREYQAAHGVVQGAVPSDSEDLDQNIEQLEALIAERRNRRES